MTAEWFGDSPISLRRFAALVNGLPPSSALHRSRNPHTAGRGWMAEHELLATLIDVVQVGNHMYLRAHSKKSAQLPEFVRMPRPDDGIRMLDKEARRDALKAKMADRGIPIRRRRKAK